MRRNKSFKLATISSLEIRVRPTAVFSALIMWALFALLSFKFLKWKPGTAAVGGFLATFIHYFSEGWHQFGHAQAAEQTGFPMSGILFNGPLGLSKYPADEGVLSPDIHIQRALGGPIFSLLLTLLTALLAFLLRPLGGPAFVVALFSAADNLLVFTIGALLPLGFTDGSTLLKWWGQRRGSHHVQINGHTHS